MPVRYKYTAIDRNGNTLRDTTSAEDVEHFLSQLHAKGLYIVDYMELSPNASTSGKLSAKNLVIFSRQLGTMLNSGIPISNALHMIQEKVVNNRAKKVFSQLYEDVQKGNSLSIAMQLQSGMFPPLLINMVVAGEAGGTLDASLMRMAEHYDKELKMNNKIKQAMTYPIILSVLAIAVVLALVTFVLPTITQMFDTDKIPWSTRMVMGFSDFLIDQWYIVIIAVLVLIIGIKIMLTNPEIRYHFDHLLLRFPIIGKLNRTIYSSRCARTFASLYLSGVPALDMIEITGRVIGNRYLVVRFDEVIASVSRGEYISNAISDTKSFDPMLGSMLYIGEEAGSLGEILIKTADYFDGESETALSRMVSLIEPLMLIVLGVVILFIIISIMQPIFEMYNSVGA